MEAFLALPHGGDVEKIQKNEIQIWPFSKMKKLFWRVQRFFKPNI